MISSRHALRGATLLLAFCGAAACTAILAPRDDVQRCGNADDCDATGDNRYVPACQYGQEQSDLDSSETDKICVAAYKPNVACGDPVSSYPNPEHPYRQAFENCADLSCAMENRGTLGCPPTDAGTCNEGLSIETYGEDGSRFCSNGDPEVIPGFALGDDDGTEGKHVKDAFCKSFFCDDTFVCGESNRCTPCDPDAPYAEGGCGIVYNEGAPAPVYLLGDALKLACDEGDADANEPHFGTCS